MTDSHRKLGKDLLEALDNSTNEPILALHKFLTPFLLCIPYTGCMDDYSKWSDPLECLLAVFFVQEDGNFRQAKDVTPIFAHTSYHIRGAILYEGHLIKGLFKNDLAK